MQTNTGPSISLSIVIPMYNEASRIHKTIESVLGFLNKSYFIENYEILLIDDGSSDNTCEVVNSFIKDNKNIRLIKHQFNKGKGEAIKTGISDSVMGYILYMDADSSVNIYELDSFINHIDKYDVIIGSRKKIKNIDNNILIFLIRKFISSIGHSLNKLLLKGIYDSQCPFKLFKGDIIRDLIKKTYISRYAVDLEILFLIQKYKYSILEVNVNSELIADSKFRLFRDTMKTFIDFISIFLNDYTGKYK